MVRYASCVPSGFAVTMGLMLPKPWAPSFRSSTASISTTPRILRWRSVLRYARRDKVPNVAGVHTYGRQLLDDDDRAAVRQVLDSDFLTQGPAIPRFEEELCRITGARNAVAVANG